MRGEILAHLLVFVELVPRPAERVRGPLRQEIPHSRGLSLQETPVLWEAVGRLGLIPFLLFFELPGFLGFALPELLQLADLVLQGIDPGLVQEGLFADPLLVTLLEGLQEIVRVAIVEEARQQERILEPSGGDRTWRGRSSRVDGFGGSGWGLHGSLGHVCLFGSAKMPNPSGG
jgi:hypothetical protein